MSKTIKTPLRNHQCPLRLMLWRTQELDHAQVGRYLFVSPLHRMFALQTGIEDKVVKMRMMRPMGKINKLCQRGK
jgi:hypothetical protein